MRRQLRAYVAIAHECSRLEQSGAWRDASVPDLSLGGMNLVTLDFDADDSDRTAPDVFAATTALGLAEYVYLPPRAQHARHVRDAESDPIIADQILPCVHWCNYVSALLLDRFDRARLGALAPGQATRREDGLVLVTAPSPATALADSAEAAMRALTNTFRAARKNGPI